MGNSVGHILVVDDDPVVLTLCKGVLQQAGFTVETVNLADRAAELLQRCSFDLILLDLHMPILDGLTLLSQIRSYDAHVPIVIITAMATFEHAVQAIMIGAQGLLLKPFSIDDLRGTVTNVLQKRRELRVYDRVAALRPLVQISQRLLTELDLPRLYESIIETVRVELNADRASLMFWDDDEKKALRIVACSGLPNHVQVGQQVKLAGSLAGWVASNGQAILIDSRGEVTPPLSDLRGVLFEDQIVSALSVPLLAGHRVLGVLNAAKTYVGLPFTEADREQLHLLASQAVIAIENARLYANIAQSEARYRALLRHATDAVLLIHAQGRRILDANPAAERLSGYHHDQLTQIEPHQLFPSLSELWGTITAQVAALAPTDLSQRPVEGASEIETALQTNEGQTIPVSISVSYVPYDGQSLVLVIARDISERQRIVQQLFQTEKLAAIGRLSASIAHEINNPLQAIHNSLHLLINHSLNDEKRQRYLSMAQDELKHLIDIVQRLIDFYRPSREGMRPTDLHDLLEAVLTLVGKQLDNTNVRLVRDFTSHLPFVYAIGNHIKQVCFNIIINAIEAMPDGGTLTIRTYVTAEVKNHADVVGPTALAFGSATSGTWAVIEFTDTGHGIPPHELPKVFEPFYTTRSKGSGLGLAISYSIIEQHHGDLSVDSAIDTGTTLRIRLPVARVDET